MQIFENAHFISCEDQNRTFKFLIEDGGRILFTGDQIPDQYRQVRTRTDMPGRCILPAFADTHMHFESYALFRATLDVRHVRNFAELSQVIREYEDQHPREKGLLGFGVSAHTVEEKKLPDRTVLDQITAKPLFLVKYDGHAAVANSALLEKLP